MLIDGSLDCIIPQLAKCKRRQHRCRRRTVIQDWPKPDVRDLKRGEEGEVRPTALTHQSYCYVPAPYAYFSSPGGNIRERHITSIA